MKSILLVEDDPFLIDIYTVKFKERGFSIDVAKNGDECFSKLEEGNPDLVLLDIVLPKLDGWEILRKLKNDGKLKGLKIVILSNLGQSQKGEVEKGMKLGAAKYLIKAHYTPTEVAEEVEKILK